MTPRVCQAIFVTALITIPLAAWFVVFAPRNAQMHAAMDDIKTRQTQLARLAIVLENVPDLESAVERGSQLIEDIEAKLPRRQHVEGVLEQIWQMARREQLTVRSVKTRAPQRHAVYMELPLEVDMAGTFEGFYEFLQSLERLPRVTGMSDLALKSAGTDPSGSMMAPGSVTARFVLRIYFADAVPALAANTEVH